MAKKPEKIERKIDAQQTENLLWSDVRDLILEARRTVARGVNAALVWTNFEIGQRIVEHEQKGKARAEYAEETLKSLSQKLTAEFGKGYSVDNLQRIRAFYLMYQKYATVSRISEKQISKTVSAKSPVDRKSATVSRISPSGFPLSWSHYVFLMGIEEENERRFYEIESANQNWSVRELRRQFNSSLYERLALSRDKEKVRDLSRKGQIVEKPEDLMKDPYVLEFLGLKEEVAYSETDLETAIINRIEHFLLELGKGFLFEARQKNLPLMTNISGWTWFFITAFFVAMS